MIFRVTKQTATVVEESFDIEAANEDDANEKFYEALETGDLSPVHTTTINRNWEITNIEETQ